MSYNLANLDRAMSDFALLERRRPKSLALGVVEELADRIRDGRLPPGAKLATEAALMGEFGVSRTVIREALSKMQASSLVETRHGVGTFVSGRSDSPVFRIRSDQLATLHTHCENLVHTFGTAIIPRARLDPSAASADERQAYLRRVNAEHGSILDAIANRDSEAARAAMRTHLANSR